MFDNARAQRADTHRRVAKVTERFLIASNTNGHCVDSPNRRNNPRLCLCRNDGEPRAVDVRFRNRLWAFDQLRTQEIGHFPRAKSRRPQRIRRTR